MRSLRRKIMTAFGLVSFAFLASCGGGGGGTPAATTSVTTGVVEKFGSIFVNGVEIKTAGAKLHLPDDLNKPEVELQNEVEVQNHLKAGMVVTVKDLVDNQGLHKAAEIEFRDNLQGVVDSKGVDFITVMGQKVLVDDPAKLAGINIGNRVEVSGLADANGLLHATHLALNNANGEFEAKGFVSSLGAGGFTLLLSPNATSGITVTPASGVALPAGLKNGDFVQVKSAASGATIVATRVKIEDVQIKPAENEKLEVEGFIGTFDTATSRFTLSNGQVVQWSDATLFVGGAKSDLALGMKVEAEGPIVGGVLMATKIAFKDNIRINANATAVDTTAKTVAILGLTVAYNSGTELKDKGNALDPATLVGRNIEVRGLLTAAGIVATRVDLKSTTPATDAFIRGPVTAVNPLNGLTIAGLAIDTRQAAFKGVTDNPLNGDAFFAAITANTTVVKARWNPFTGDPAAPVKEVELEN
jgi:Domain of unknown function (DUF5666)